MRFLTWIVFALLLFAPLAVVERANAGMLYGATGTGSGTGTLGIIDPTTGAFTPIGPINDSLGNNFRVTGLAFHPTTGVLYGSSNNNSPTAPGSLITIDPKTAEAKVVGTFGFPGQTMADITFRGNVLYGWLEPSLDSLFVINTATGAAKITSFSGLGTFGSGLAADSGGTIYFAGNGDGGALHTLDPITGDPTIVAFLSGSPINAGSIPAMAFDEKDTLFAVNSELGNLVHLITINTTTGEITDIGQTMARLDAIAFGPEIQSVVPEPASIALFGMGVAGLVFYRHRARKAGK